MRPAVAHRPQDEEAHDERDAAADDRTGEDEVRVAQAAVGAGRRCPGCGGNEVVRRDDRAAVPLRRDRGERCDREQPVHEPLPLDLPKVDGQRDRPEGGAVSRRHHEQVDVQVVALRVVDRPPVELLAERGVGVDGDVAAAPIAPTGLATEVRRHDLVDRGRVLPLDAVVHDHVDRLVDELAVGGQQADGFLVGGDVVRLLVAEDLGRVLLRLGQQCRPRENEPGEDERDHDCVRKALPLPRRAEDSHHRATACARKRLVFVRLPQTDIAHQREDELRERS